MYLGIHRPREDGRSSGRRRVPFHRGGKGKLKAPRGKGRDSERLGGCGLTGQHADAVQHVNITPVVYSDVIAVGPYRVFGIVLHASRGAHVEGVSVVGSRWIGSLGDINAQRFGRRIEFAYHPAVCHFVVLDYRIAVSAVAGRGAHVVHVELVELGPGLAPNSDDRCLAGVVSLNEMIGADVACIVRRRGGGCVSGKVHDRRVEGARLGVTGSCREELLLKLSQPVPVLRHVDVWNDYASVVPPFGLDLEHYRGRTRIRKVPGGRSQGRYDRLADIYRSRTLGEPSCGDEK